MVLLNLLVGVCLRNSAELLSLEVILDAVLHLLLKVKLAICGELLEHGHWLNLLELNLLLALLVLHSGAIFLAGVQRLAQHGFDKELVIRCLINGKKLLWIREYWHLIISSIVIHLIIRAFIKNCYVISINLIIINLVLT